MKTLHFWLKFSAFNFFVVAVLGILMRYKIAFSLPFVEQKYLQEAHSHFAFYGWISAVIYILIVQYLDKNSLDTKAFKIPIIGNMVASYGMLFSFLYGGYFWMSILFSTSALLSNVLFFYFLYHKLKNFNDPSKIWFLGAFFFALFSSLGVLSLSVMMATKHVVQDLYLASTYFYLHFQYNGFFELSCIGLLLFSLKEIGIEISEVQNRNLFLLLFLGTFFCYGLSVLWMNLPLWIYITVILASISQTVGVVKLFTLMRNNWDKVKKQWSPFQRCIILYVGFALAAKTALQLGSTIPAVNQFAFGFRNIVIAYLHLVLLMFISVFLFGQILSGNCFKMNKALVFGTKFLMFTIFLNELMLGVIGVFSIQYISIPYNAEILFGIACGIGFSLMLILFNLKKAN